MHDVGVLYMPPFSALEILLFTMSSIICCIAVKGLLSPNPENKVTRGHLQYFLGFHGMRLRLKMGGRHEKGKSNVFQLAIVSFTIHF